MKQNWTLIALAVVSLAAGGRAQDQRPPLPKGQMPDLGRPTKLDDEQPPLNVDEYFTGTWRFEWDMPDGPLGESGRITGTTTYKVIDAGKFYQAETRASGPGGAFTVRELIAYQKDQKALSRWVTDSRGFTYLQIASIGGDLGGIYNIFYDSTPFTYNGKTIRLKHALRLLSPFNYKVATSVSVDGGAFRNYGNPWWRKDAAPSK
jgi:hypothetical protein